MLWNINFRWKKCVKNNYSEVPNCNDDGASDLNEVKINHGNLLKVHHLHNYFSRNIYVSISLYFHPTLSTSSAATVLHKKLVTWKKVFTHISKVTVVEILSGYGEIHLILYPNEHMQWIFLILCKTIWVRGVKIGHILCRCIVEWVQDWCQAPKL